MPRVNKIKLGKARSALVKAGMSAMAAAQYVRMLDINEPLGPQITELAEDMPDLFGLDSDGNELPDDEDDDKPMTARERQVAALRGRNVERQTFRRPAEERPSTASKAAQEAAAHLRQGVGNNKPPTRRWYADEPKPLNAPPPVRQRPASADVLAARLRGN